MRHEAGPAEVAGIVLDELGVRSDAEYRAFTNRVASAPDGVIGFKT